MLVLANFFWGLSFPLIKSMGLIHRQIEPESSSWFITAWSLGPRFLISTALMLLWHLRVRGSFTGNEWRQGLMLGVFAASGMVFQTDGLQFTAASTSAFLTQFYAILIPIFLAARQRRFPPWTVFVSSTLVLIGVAILGHFSIRTLQFGRGEFETLIASVFFMGQILTLDHRSFANNRVVSVSLIMFAAQAVAFVILGFATAPHLSALIRPFANIPWAVQTAIMGVFCTAAALFIMNTFQPRITATEAGLMYCVEPIFGSILSLFLPALLSAWSGIAYANETASKNLLLGGGLITAANVLIQLKPLGRPSGPQ